MSEPNPNDWVRGQQFARLTVGILSHPAYRQLSAETMHVLGAILAHSNVDGIARPGAKKLCDITGRDERNVRRAIQIIRQLPFVSVIGTYTGRDGKGQNIYQFITPDIAVTPVSIDTPVNLDTPTPVNADTPPLSALTPLPLSALTPKHKREQNIEQKTEQNKGADAPRPAGSPAAAEASAFPPAKNPNTAATQQPSANTTNSKAASAASSPAKSIQQNATVLNAKGDTVAQPPTARKSAHGAGRPAGLTDDEKRLVCSDYHKMARYIARGAPGLRGDRTATPTPYDFTNTPGFSSETPHPELWTHQQIAGYWWMEVSRARQAAGERITIPLWPKLIGCVRTFISTRDSDAWYTGMQFVAQWWPLIKKLAMDINITLKMNETTMLHSVVVTKAEQVARMDPEYRAAAYQDALACLAGASIDDEN